MLSMILKIIGKNFNAIALDIVVKNIMNLQMISKKIILMAITSNIEKHLSLDSLIDMSAPLSIPNEVTQYEL